MAADSGPKVIPKLVKVNKSLKLAEAWVNNMSKPAVGELNEVDFEGRPARLGLGAKVVRNSKPAASSDPVERRLLGKLNAAKRRSAQNSENDGKDGGYSGEDDDEPESRTKISAKRLKMPPVTSAHSMKKK